tara:strand:+ start:192 stop:395 length:204 start_codon:yes stop_codon:yes gene_type:complete
MYDFEYKRATTNTDATNLYSESEDPRFLAGGMTLIPVLKQRLDQPTDLIDLADISDLKGISLRVPIL